MASAAGVNRYSVSFRRSSQLVRASLLHNATARSVWPIARVLYDGVYWSRGPHGCVRLVAFAVPDYRLVIRGIPDSDCTLEHFASCMVDHAGLFAIQTKTAQRLELGHACHSRFVRIQLASAGVIQLDAGLRSSTSCPLVPG